LLNLPFGDENADDEVLGLPSLQQCLESGNCCLLLLVMSFSVVVIISSPLQQWFVRK